VNPLIKSAFSIIFSFSLIQPSAAQCLASSYQPKNKTERLILAKIRALPEVRDFYNYVKNDKPDFMINPPESSSNNCYAMQVGIDYGDVFHTYFWLLIDPKTFKIYYWDLPVESGSGIITLQQWRYWRTKPGFDKVHVYKNGRLIVSQTENHAKKKSSHL
jgi:hypothetical protein